jgi:predicted nucleic-acid-binding protein
MVCKTVLLELEWVMRGYYGFNAEEIACAFSHLLSLGHVHMEDRPGVTQALSHMSAGLDFADALHLAAYRECDEMISFDDKRFARRAQRLNLSPRVVVQPDKAKRTP